ncbi:MAG: BamA/TamA family outer membrane protein [Flavobacteriales bacterium]|nr:BamA/TamA family outer membrane protein [Flavobacteriales bacterium]
MVLTACTGTKYATVERPLFTGYTVQFAQVPEADAKSAELELMDVVTPQPNEGLFGFRPLVALYNMTGEPKRKGKGLRHLLKYKIATAPVYLDQVPAKDIDAAMSNRMNNRGYFSARTTHEVIRKGGKAELVFTVEPGRVHRMRTILYGDTALASRDSLYRRIGRAQGASTLKAEQPYHLAALVNERARVADGLRNAGFYRMNADLLEFAADTSVGDHQVDLRLRVKGEAGANERRRYTIGSVHVHGDHDDLLPPTDTTKVDSLWYIDYLGMYRPHTITRGVFIQPGRYFSQRRLDATRQYLASYGVFGSVAVDLTDDTLRAGVLNADVILTPQERFSLFSELNAISKSNNFAGPGLKVGWRDRDLFRGAEVFTADLSGRFETQLAGAGKGTNAYEISAKTALSIPRLLLLGRLKSTRQFAPTTRIDLGYGLFRRIGLYGLESANLGYSYVWRQNRFVWHDVRVPEVSYNNLYYTSDQFNAFLGLNPSIRRSFEEQFIIGVGYTYTRTNQQGKADRDWWMFSIGADEAGGLTSLVSSAVEGPRTEDGYRLFGERYAQYVRFRVEGRWFQGLGRNGSQLATRVLAASAHPYGNSSTVPYVKQFFSGGTNSLRAFRARSVGPGSYDPERNGSGEGNSSFLVDQVGDIKFELNVEYRFPISGIVKGALFTDAGNVWLQQDDPQRPAGEFRWQNAVNELAVGAGFGLRIDPEVIVIRLDLATPLRRPELPQGDRWVFDDQRPQVFDNLVLNIAIGYPF